MELNLLKLAVEKLYSEVQELKGKNSELELSIAQLQEKLEAGNQHAQPQIVEDELIDTKQVLNYLGVCYNTLRSIINKGLIKPIRINQRRIRYSKVSIQKYLDVLKVQPT